jgi:cytochrome bd ubiquinol oxidase subunit II
MLATIWFILWGILWALYFMLDGFDLGLGTLMPFLAKSERDKRVIYNSMGPFWDGNEVWLITAGGATFAAFPGTYAVMFSTMYSALMILLFALIFRGVSFEFRGKVDSPAWKRIWDISLTAGSFIPALLFGVAFANIFKGIPFDGRGVYHGTLLTLLNPYGLLGGVLFLFLFMEHGALWLVIKAEGELSDRARRAARLIWPSLLITAVGFLIATWFATDLWTIYVRKPLFLIIPGITVISLLLTFIYSNKSPGKAWFASSLTILGTTLFGVTGLYPNLFPSSLSRSYSMTIYNSASSPLTLKIMLTVALIFVPLVIGYQTWVYLLFKEKVTDQHLNQKEAY